MKGIKLHIIMAGASAETDTELLCEMFSNLGHRIGIDIDLIICPHFESAVDILKKDLVDFAIIGKYVPDKSHTDIINTTELQACIRNSNILCDVWRFTCVLVDTEKNPSWLKKLEKLLEE